MLQILIIWDIVEIFYASVLIMITVLYQADPIEEILRHQVLKYDLMWMERLVETEMIKCLHQFWRQLAMQE